MEYTTIDKISENLDGKRKPITSSDRTEGNIPYYGASGIVDYVEDYIFNESLLLVSEDGANLLARSTPIAFSIEGKTWVNNHAHVLRFSNTVQQKYVELYLNHISLEAYITGSAQPKLNQKKLNEIPIPVVSEQEMTEVVATIEKIQNIIRKRKKELATLDKLIKARFVEMFGNPVTNDKGWDTDSCKNLMSKIGSGATPKGGRESYCDKGISLIRSMNVYNNRFEYKDLAHITDEQAEQLDNVTIEKDDVLLNITGASVARCCVVPGDLLPARVNQHVSIIRCKERILPDFVCCMFTEDNYQRLLWSIATAGGATREAITKQQIEELMLIVPPIDLQKQFMKFVQQVDKSKVAVQKALEETQILFDSLMQDYFG